MSTAVNKRPASREPLIHITKRDGIFWGKAWAIRVIAFALALLVCGVVAFLLIDKLRENPARIGEFYASFINGSFSTTRKVWKFLKNTAVLLSIALALTPAFRMRFWNTGAEGQTLVGVLSAVAVDFYLGGKIAEPILLVLMLLAALVSGAAWGLLPAVFKAVWNTNETLFTLMMNYVAANLVTFCLAVWVTNGSNSLPKLQYGALPVIGQEYLLIILIVVVLMVLEFIYLNYSKQGYEINVVGESERTAEYVGISVRKVIIRTMLLSGMLCGLAGFLIASGLDRSVTTNSVGGQGFTAILVSWLAKFNPLVMALTAALIIMLNQGAAQISQNFNIDNAFPDVVVGIILFFIIGSEFFINYEIHFRKNTPAEVTAK